MQSEASNTVADENQTFVEGLDFYFENGMMVLTRRYLLNRGFCCDNKCRHCPFRDAESPLE
ncbi:MAG: hypothetical protein IPM59_06140 [Chloracidobacterium sp.]|nr:hypothetical protein [Chloracidobacterium sp.]